METRLAYAFYNRVEPEHGQDRPHIVDRIRPQLTRAIKPGMRVLDLGCGAGRFTFVVEEMGAVPAGVDCAGNLLDYARVVAESEGRCARFVQGDYCELPFAPESFDVVLLIDNLVECSYDGADLMVAQVRRILSPGGLLCLSMADRLEKHRQGYDLTPFDPSTGMKVAMHDPDGQGPVPYHACFWTLPFAKYLFSRHLTLLEEEALSSGKHWLVYAKGPES